VSHQDLTERQVRILRLCAAGHTHQQIGKRMHLSQGFIGAELTEIRTRLRARNTAHAAALGVVHGIVTAEHLELP
jgi:DNA-binding NarL/FixJ family response regulator